MLNSIDSEKSGSWDSLSQKIFSFQIFPQHHNIPDCELKADLELFFTFFESHATSVHVSKTFRLQNSSMLNGS